jgi:hypothetical protein
VRTLWRKKISCSVGNWTPILHLYNPYFSRYSDWTFRAALNKLNILFLILHNDSDMWQHNLVLQYGTLCEDSSCSCQRFNKIKIFPQNETKYEQKLNADVWTGKWGKQVTSDRMHTHTRTRMAPSRCHCRYTCFKKRKAPGYTASVPKPDKRGNVASRWIILW